MRVPYGCGSMIVLGPETARKEWRARIGAQIGAGARPRVIAVRVRDHRARDWRPRIDVEITGRTVQACGRFSEHRRPSCTIDAMAAPTPPHLLRSLRHRNYRLFVTGQSISLIGTWITRLATSWLVYRLTDSAFLLGLVGFCSQIPTLFLGPLAGVFVDRWDRHRVLLFTQALSLVQSATLAVTHAFWRRDGVAGAHPAAGTRSD